MLGVDEDPPRRRRLSQLMEGKNVPWLSVYSAAGRIMGTEVERKSEESCPHCRLTVIVADREAVG